MIITVINGSTRRGSTRHCMELFRHELSQYEELEVTEFNLPDDMPHFCKGCFSCFMNGEHTCPHSNFIEPIVKAMEQSDLIIITSSVYALDVTGQLKALLDHLCYMWITHRPNPAMFCKVGLSIVTTAGAGLNHTTKTIQNSLFFWCTIKNFSFKKAVAASSWDEISKKNKDQIIKEIKKKARKIVITIHKAERQRKPLKRSFMFQVMKMMMKNNKWCQLDRTHWNDNGWLDGKKPF